MSYKRNSAFSISITDPDNSKEEDQITGLITIGDRLYAFKKLGIYELLPADSIDPENKDLETRHTYSKVFSIGSKSVLVSRMIIQFDEILKGIEGELEDSKLDVPKLRSYVWNANKILLECEGALFKIYKQTMDLYPRCDEIIENNKSKAFIPALPRVEDLDQYCVAFFSGAKRFLLASYGLLDFFFDVPVKYRKFSEYQKWASSKFGEGHDISKMLRDDEKWVRTLAECRNAQEHPGENFQVDVFNFKMRSGNKFSTPSWKYNLDKRELGQSEEFDIIQSFEAYLQNMLTLFEEILLLSLEQLPGFSSRLEIIKFPIDRMDEACPVLYGLKFKRLEEILGKNGLIPNPTSVKV